MDEGVLLVVHQTGPNHLVETRMNLASTLSPQEDHFGTHFNILHQTTPHDFPEELTSQG